MHKLLLGIAASSLLATGALAHEATPAPAPVVAPVYNSATFDWDGFYVGVGLTGLALSTGVNYGFADVIAGVNITSGKLLFGLEGWFGVWSNSVPATGYGGGAEARVGYLATPDALLYVSGGGYIAHNSDKFGTLGAGVEFAISDNASIDFEYKYWFPSHGVHGNSLGASLNWGF